jgi:hypothetical protein
MTVRQITAALAALALGVGLATACGGGGSRESVDQSNQGELTAPGSQSTIETGPTTLGATGETQQTVTQTETGP